MLSILFTKTGTLYWWSSYSSISVSSNFIIILRLWHYLAVKKLSALREITSKSNGEFFYLNCLHSFRIKNKVESHKKECNNKDFCNVIMPSEDTEIL